MPTLPTLTVSTAQATRLMAAFGDTVDPDTGLMIAPPVAYLRWLRQHLVEHVIDQEAIRLDVVDEAQKRAALAALSDSMPPIPPVPTP